ncbi:MFS transporter [Xylanivirga thermophila]|uniref:MFS transporter n=1 Tax=Xylanivirga thermophila TaxID=2496273 RepID=UPI0013E9BFCD|nr:MFS transporter [Xylanivirga thermophila]
MENNINRKGSVAALYASFFLIGITVTVYGPTINYLMKDYNISMGKASLFVTFMSMGRTLSVLASGILSDKAGRKPILFGGTLCLTLGLLGIGTLSWYTGGLIFAVIAGVGHGMLDTSASAAISDLYPEKMSRALNRLHMFFGIGCLIGPIISGSMLALGCNWRYIYLVNAIIGLLITIFIWFQSFPQIQNVQTSDAGKGHFIISSTVIALGLILFIYSGVGQSINTWINKYMGDVVNFPIFFAAGTLAIYNLGITLGRLFSSFISEKIGYYRWILYASIGSLVGIVMAFMAGVGIIIVIGLFITGFFFGGLFPTVIAIAGNIYPNNKGAITGGLVTIAAIGSMSVPAIIGFMSQDGSLQSSVKWLIALVALMVIIVSIMQYKKKEN